VELNDEDKAELKRVCDALASLFYTNPVWRLNYNNFYIMTLADQYRWWYRAKAQARLGAPAMQTLLAKVIELRLTGR